MKTYVMTTGAIFGLLTIAHVWRIVVESHLAKDLPYIAITVVSAALCLWAVQLIRRAPRA